MYFTSGANVRTSRSRSWRSPERWYFCQRASASSAETRPRAGDITDIGGTPWSGNGGNRRGEHGPYRPLRGVSSSPLDGIAQLPFVQAAHPQFWGEARSAG